MNSTTFKILKYLALTIAALAFLWFGYSWAIGDNLTLPWQVESTFKTRPFLLEYFHLNGKPFGVVVDQVISWQKFRTGDLEFIAWPHYLLLASVFSVLILGTLSITYLDRFSYFIFSGIVVFFIIQLRLEELGIGAPYLTFGLIVSFLGVTYLFQAIKKKTSIFIRLAVICLLYSSFGVLINVLPNMDYPNMVTLSFGIMGPLLWITLFIVFIAGDNIYSLFKLTTQGETNGKNGLIHFGIIGLVYVTIVSLLFLEKDESLTLNLYLIEPRSFLIASMISGYFCFEKKIETINISGDTFVLKQWLYPALCGLVLSFYAYADLMAIDALYNALDWVVLISHLAFGAGFFVYALINFIPGLLENYRVWPIFFKGPRTPMLTIRLFCVIMVVGGFLYLEYRPYYMAKSGQYTMLASLAGHLDNGVLSKQYHKQANYFEFYNYRSNYALTRSARTEQEKEDISQRLIAILRGGQNPKARVAYSNHLESEGDLYGTLSSLLYSPEMEYNDQVKNNLGMAHYEYQNYDSAFKYFNQSLGKGKFVSESNLAALNYDRAAQVDFDTAINYQYLDNIHLKLNRQALANAQRQFLPFSIELRKDTLLTREQLFYIYNAALSREREDHETVNNAIEFYQSNWKNSQYNTFLLTAQAFLYYNSGQVNKAFRTIELVISSNLSAAGFPYYTKAVWAYDQGQPDLTVESINNARKRGFDEPTLRNFVEELKYVEEYDRNADISYLLEGLLAKTDELGKEELKKELVEIAGLNAFDVYTTLMAVEELMKLEHPKKEIYELLRASLQVKSDSPELLEAYIYACARNNYRTFGETALGKLQDLVDRQKWDQVSKGFKKILAQKQSKLIN